jgi:hypothetical protein
MLLCPNGPYTSFNQFCIADNRCEELTVQTYLLSIKALQRIFMKISKSLGYANGLVFEILLESI